jgi:hypothetical protein
MEQRVYIYDGPLDDYQEDLMELRIFLIVIAVIIVALFPLAPKLIRFRIAIFRKLKWNGLANFLEKYFDQFVIIARVIMALIVIFLVFLILRA